MLNYFNRIMAAKKRDDEQGASAVEYGLLVAAIAAIIVLIVFSIGTYVRAGFEKTCDGLATGSYANATTPTACP